MEKFSSNNGKVHFEGLVHLLIFIRVNKNLGLKYFAKIEDSNLSELLRQTSIDTENQLMVFSDSSRQLSRYWKKYRRIYCVLSRCTN